MMKRLLNTHQNKSQVTDERLIKCIVGELATRAKYTRARDKL